MTGDFNHFPELAAALETATSQILRKTAFDIQANAQAAAPVGETGFLKSSIYTNIEGDSTYGHGAVAPGPGGYLVPEITDVQKGEAYIAVGANYGVYQEMGTRYMPAQPYLTPAAEMERAAFLMAWQRLEDLLAQHLGGGL